MRTSKRLEELNARVDRARMNILQARQKLIYNEKDPKVLELLNAAIRELFPDT